MCKPQQVMNFTDHEPREVGIDELIQVEDGVPEVSVFRTADCNRHQVDQNSAKVTVRLICKIIATS